MPPGRAGTGEVSLTRFAVPTDSLPFWRRRLAEAGAPVSERTVLGATEIVSADGDGFAFSLGEAPADPRPGWATPAVSPDRAVRGFSGVALTLSDGAATTEILTGLFGYRVAGTEGAVTRLEQPGVPSGSVDVVVRRDLPVARSGAGRVHHVAFRVADRAVQAKVRAEVAER